MAANNVDVLSSILRALDDIAESERKRVLETVCTYFGVAPRPGQASPSKELGSFDESPPLDYSADTAPSPKEFLLDKHPTSDVERVACLAYYTTVYRDVHEFKTLDLSKLNAEAAQPKFSNAASAVSNSVKCGYLIQGTGGRKKLSAHGEQFVKALPDREAARAAMKRLRLRRTSRRKARESNKDGNGN